MKKAFLFACLFFFFACKTKQVSHLEKKEPAPAPTQETRVKEDLVCAELRLLEKIEDKSLYIPVQIRDYTYSEGCICFTFSYSGCGKKEALVVWDEKHDDKIHQPPIAHLAVWVSDPGMCEAYITDQLCVATEQLKLLGDKVLVEFPEEGQNLLIDFQY